MSGKHKLSSMPRKSSISILLAATLALSAIVAVPMVSTASTPAVTSVSPESGTAAGGNVITITGQALTSATNVRIDGVPAANFTVVDDSTISATLATRVGASRTVGRVDVTVEIDNGANATGDAYYTYRPVVQAADSGNGQAAMVTMSTMASRTQAKPISRSTTAPFTVTGTDSISGASYSYVTDVDKSDWQSVGVRTGLSVEEGWQNEGHEAVGTSWAGKSNGLTGTITASAAAVNSLNVPSGYVNLRSSGSCSTNNQVTVGGQLVDSYCSVFGPQVYSESFYATAGQSLAFSWAADDNGDDYEIYAFLVKVADDSLQSIPVPSPSNHTLIEHSSGKRQALTTSSGTIVTSDLYRFRFVNGTYDATGGLVLGSNMYVDPVITVGVANTITLPAISDRAGYPGSLSVVATATSGAAVSVTASGSSGCTVATSYSSPNTTVNVSWTGEGSCVLSATQGAVGSFAPAARVTQGFTVTEGPPPGSGGSGTMQQLTHVASLPAAPRTNTARVSLFGTHFDTVTEVYVGGKKVEMLGQSANELRVRLPGGLTGFVDVEIRSTIGNLKLVRHFNFRGKSSSNRAELIVGGFEQNSRVLTPRMRAEIERWLAKHSNLKTITCTGFTSLPRRTTDVALSTNRGATSCNFAKRERPDLVTTVKPGIEDPRPGSNIRRVRLVLTP